MIAIQTHRFRPDFRILRDVAWRAGLVVVASAAIVIGLPAWACAPLSLAAALFTTLFVLRRTRGRGALDATLTAVGVIVVVLALLGLLLNVLPAGISSASWGVGVGVVELVALVGMAYLRAPNSQARSGPRRVPVAAVVWAVLVTVVLSGALVWSIASFNSTHIAPLAIAATPSGTGVVVTVTSGHDDGPYDLELVGVGGRTLLARNIHVSPGNSASVVVEVPSNTRETVQLVRAGSEKSVRDLILDTTSTTTKVTP